MYTFRNNILKIRIPCALKKAVHILTTEKKKKNHRKTSYKPLVFLVNHVLEQKIGSRAGPSTLINHL